MALWKITARISGTAPCKNKRQKVEKGMFIETSTISSTPPINIVKERETLASLFMNKYGIEIDPRCVVGAYFTCEKIG